MGHVDLGAARNPVEPGAEPVALAGRIEAVQQAPDRTPDEILGQLGTILGPVRLHDPGLGRFGVDDESGLLPEVAHEGPELLGRHRGAEPALLAGAFDAHRAGFGLRRPGGYRVALGGLDLATAALVARVGWLGGE